MTARTASVARRAPAIGGAGVQVGHRLDVGERGIDRVAHALLIERVPFSAVGVEPERERGRRADADREPAAAAVLVERDLRRRRDEGEVALPRVDLMKADADAPLRPDRKAHRGEAGGLRQRRHHRADEEIRGRDLGALSPLR